ncbi:glycosyltransferase family 4 protein [Halomicroarcula sp. GCM10025709]|uniref:glycosyltransferase family 4 protein n=1 Tax=Halomicroarcula sp. GCM10025709 TaxID=3252669 RepID=UPI0036085D1A
MVLWLASIKPWKQPERFVEVARRCRDLPCEFWLVGRPVERALADRLTEQADRLPNLRYLGGCTVAESDDYIEQASVFVNTSTQEGFPNTFIQSWLRRTPVVSLNVDPTDDAGDHPTGYYAVGDIETLTDRVRELITDPQRRRALGDSAFEYAREHNDIRRVVDRIEAGLPDAVVDGGGRDAGDRASRVTLDQ